MQTWVAKVAMVNVSRLESKPDNRISTHYRTKIFKPYLLLSTIKFGSNCGRGGGGLVLQKGKKVFTEKGVNDCDKHFLLFLQYFQNPFFYRLL